MISKSFIAVYNFMDATIVSFLIILQVIWVILLVEELVLFNVSYIIEALRYS
jgi:hypothetical protein